MDSPAYSRISVVVTDARPCARADGLDLSTSLTTKGHRDDPLIPRRRLGARLGRPGRRRPDAPRSRPQPPTAGRTGRRPGRCRGATRPAAPRSPRSRSTVVGPTSFKMVRSTASINANCLPNAKAKVSITAKGSVEVMKVTADGPAQEAPSSTSSCSRSPDFPFGLSWYQGDLKTDKHGKATASSSAGSTRRPSPSLRDAAPAPVVHAGDASDQPGHPPVHQYHLGFWFNDPADAAEPAAAPASPRSTGSTTPGPRP